MNLPCASSHSLQALLQPWPTPSVRPDPTIIPLWHTEARSLGLGACLTSRVLLFHYGESRLGMTALQDQHKVDGHLVYSAANPHMANTTHSLGSVSPTNTAAAVAAPTISQSGRRPQTKRGRLDQTNAPACGKVARLFKQRGDWLCVLLFIAAFIWGRNRLSEGREAQSSKGTGFVRQSRLSTPHGKGLWAQGYYYPPSSTCPLWIIISTSATINHF